MTITQKWHTSRGTPCETERLAQIREDAESLAAEAHGSLPGVPFKLMADALALLMTRGKLTVPLRVEGAAPQSAEEFYR